MMRVLGKYVFLLTGIGLFCACDHGHTIKATTKANPLVHVAHLSAGWYPQDEKVLLSELTTYFNLAHKYFTVVDDSTKIRVLVVPHAGWYFSGLCAATAYQTLLDDTRAKNKHIRKVVVLSPSHTTFLTGCALPNYDCYKTALGTIDVDLPAIEILKKCSFCKGDQRAHQQEHAIEIQLPFLQYCVEKFTLVPLIIGHMTDESFAFLIKELKRIIDDHTLVVVSSDFVHHGESYEYVRFKEHILPSIRSVDSWAVDALRLQSYQDFEQMLRETDATICGQNPLKILLGLINTGALKDINARLTCYYTSAHMNKARTADKSINVSRLLTDVADQEARESVSYVGMIFTQQSYDVLAKKDILTGYEKRALLALARASIENRLADVPHRVDNRLLYPIASFGMVQPVGAFVTLNTKKGDLRGCIGRIVTQDLLYQTVNAMAQAAAFQDTRFEPVKKSELDNLVIDISILSKPHKVSGYKDIQLGKHGIILNKISDGRIVASAVFLPQVPQSFGWDLETTLGHLSQKAGLAWDGWREGCQFEVFEGYEIKED